jgi:hypothetical protein
LLSVSVTNTSPPELTATPTGPCRSVNGSTCGLAEPVCPSLNLQMTASLSMQTAIRPVVGTVTALSAQ